MDLPPPTLQYMTNHAYIDALLRGLVGLCELTFPQRIQAYYLVGSYADGSAIPSSDLDLFIIFSADLRDRESTTITQLFESCHLISPIRLDLNVVGEQQLRAGVSGTCKIAKLLYGTPILDALPLAPRDRHLQRSLRNAFHTSYLLRQRAENLVFPLTYPDPTGDFYGYEQWGMYLGARAFGLGVRTLLSGATYMATALVLLETDYPFGLIWIDAHPDLETPETSRSGNIHGMAAAHLLGKGIAELCRLLTGAPVIQPNHLVYIGLRDASLAEREIIRSAGVKAYTISDVIRYGIAEVCERALSHLRQQTDGIKAAQHRIPVRRPCRCDFGNQCGAYLSTDLRAFRRRAAAECYSFGRQTFKYYLDSICTWMKQMKKIVSTEATSSNIAKITDLLADTPRQLESLSQHFSPEQLRQPLGSGERSVTEVLAHLLNCEARSAETIYLALLAEEPAYIDIHPERQWGKLLRYELLAFSDLLAYFKLRRSVLVRVLASLTEAQWSRTIREDGKKRKESVYWRARSMALHELEHLSEIQSKLNGSGTS